MKYFLIKAFLFIIPLIFVFKYQESLLYRYPNWTNLKKKNFEKSMKNIRTLILGSSYSMYGINPEYFDQGYNLANVSQTLYYDNELLKKYIDSLPRLKTIIISVSYFSFGFNLFDDREKFRCFIYKKYWNIDFPENRFYFPENYSNLFIYKNKYLRDCILGKTKTVINPDGYSCCGELKSDPEEGEERIRYHESVFYRKKNLTKNVNFLNEIISVSGRKGIQVILVELPVYSSYTKLMDPEIENFKDSVLNIYANSYREVIHLNYLRDKRFGISDFSDCDHLNCDGAEKLSKILAEDIYRLR